MSLAPEVALAPSLATEDGMPTRRWMYIAPASFACIALELLIMFGFHWGMVAGIRSGGEDINGKFYVFLALMVGQAGLWGYLGCLCCEWVWQIWPLCKNGPSFKRLPSHYRMAIVTRFVSAWAAVAVWALIVSRMTWDLGPFQLMNIQFAGLLGFFPGVMAVSAMWIVEVAVYSSLPKTGRVSRTSIDCYLRLRGYLGNFLTVGGIILALGTLDINASRAFIKAACEENFFPQDLVIVFGGVFTVLLGMAYAPAYLALRTLGSKVRDSIVPQVLPNAPDMTSDKDGELHLVEQWAEDREKLGDLLQLDIRDWKSFGPQFAIVAPLATGLASRLVGGGRL